MREKRRKRGGIVTRDLKSTTEIFEIDDSYASTRRRMGKRCAVKTAFAQRHRPFSIVVPSLIRQSTTTDRNLVIPATKHDFRLLYSRSMFITLALFFSIESVRSSVYPVKRKSRNRRARDGGCHRVFETRVRRHKVNYDRTTPRPFEFRSKKRSAI